MELNRPMSTITSALDGDVLAVLVTRDAVFTTGQLHRVLPQHSAGGIRKVLQRLVKQGVVRSERVGNAFTYRFNHDHLAAEYVAGLARLQETFLERLEKRLESWEISPVYAAVFGSAARGSMTVESDLDLLLVRPDGTEDALWEKQVADLMAEVTGWIGNDVRPLEFTADEVVAHGRDEPVLRAVLDEGLTVAGTRTWLAKQLRNGK